MTDTTTRYNLGPVKGEKGEQGEEGKQGEQGLRGEALTYNMLTPEQKLELKGATGPAGMDGENGATFTPTVASNGDLSWGNDKGLPNPSTVNIKGDTGATGSQGIQGVKGDTGAVYTPSVDSNGNLSWTNNGGLTNPSTVNIKGPKGDTGNVQINTMFVTSKSNLPSTGDTGVLYFVLVRSTDTENKFDEYIWDDDNSRYELVGGGTVDLTNYYNKTEIDTALSNKANTSTTYTKSEVDALIGNISTYLGT